MGAFVSGDVCSEDEKRAALERALSSRTFARSEQLRSFLRYVCEAECRGTGGHLTEYLIGVEVLRRPADYSPAEDSSVRTRAYELRQKLEKLYASELPGEPIRIVIPKGSYAPRYRRDTEPAPLELPPAQEQPVREKSLATPSHNRLKLASLLLTAALLGMLAAFAFGRHGTAVIDPVVAEAWGAFAKQNNTMLLVPATPLYMVLGPATHAAFATATYPAPPEAYPLFRQHRPLPNNAQLGMVFTNDALGVGSMNAVVIASTTVRGLGASAQILPERASMMPELHDRDAVLFGAPVDSQLISDFLQKTPFSVLYNEQLKEFVVEDRVSGETIAPEMQANGDFSTVYGLVTALNYRDSDHGRLGLLIFSGITSVGTHGAAEYFASPQSLHALKELFQHDGLKGFPPAYQVVVKCKFENMLLVSAEYYSHRILRRE